MQRLNFAIIKLTFFLVLGILLGYFTRITLYHSIPVFLILLSFLIISYFYEQQQLKHTVWFGSLLFITTLVLGITIENIHEEKQWKHHYSNYSFTDFDKNNIVEITITEVLKPSLYQDKYIARLYALNNKSLTGKLLVNVDKDSLQPNLSVGDIVLTKTILKPIVKPLNPHGFDYSNYLKKQYVYHQIYVHNSELLVQENSRKSILSIAHNIRKTINKKLKKYNFKEDELAIINAMLLGQRKDLSKSLSDMYASAGVIHILAVSGLHVGVILLLLQYILKPLNYFKRGKTLKIVLIVAILWLFAIIAGLSASVVRAVTMFSIVAISINLKRATSIFNTLAISMFILLLFKPLFLFSVGFQLSYLAVFAIVWIQPMIYKLWSPKFKAIDYFWQIFTVTIAAQIGVVPLSLFYFHQFPGLFFISNLIIIPFLGVILGLGIIVILLSLCNLLPQILADVYGCIIYLLNSFVAWVSQQEAFLFKNISFGITTLVLSYLFIIFLIRFLKQKYFKDLALTLLVIIGFQISFLHSEINPTNQFVIFNKSRHSAIGFKEHDTLHIHHNFNDLKKETWFNNFIVGDYINTIKTDSLKSVYRINNKLLVIVDSLGAYNVSFKPDMILLRNSPKINLNRLIDRVQPNLIIADGSNYKSYVVRWRTTCKKLKLPFHATTEKGALTIDYTNK